MPNAVELVVINFSRQPLSGDIVSRISFYAIPAYLDIIMTISMAKENTSLSMSA